MRLAILIAPILVATTACASRVQVITATTVGLKLSGSPNSELPVSVAFAYKRAELAVVPTANLGAEAGKSDAYSVFSAIDFRNSWFNRLALSQVIATGIAAQTVSAPGTFTDVFADTAQRSEIARLAAELSPKALAKMFADLGIPAPQGRADADALLAALDTRTPEERAKAWELLRGLVARDN